jgi:hypothetical protein
MEELLFSVINVHIFSDIILIELWATVKLARLIEMCLNETYSEIHRNKYFSSSILFLNCPKQEDALSPLRFKFALEYAFR